jgi:hypothetical protein
VTPRWQEADAAVEALVAALLAEAARTAGRGGRVRPRGRKRSRRPKSTRHHIAEVIRAYRLAPGRRVDRNVVAALFLGHRNLVSDPVLVVAVARACAVIAGRKLSAKKAARLRSASLRVAELIARADADTLRLPAPRKPQAAAVAPEANAAVAEVAGPARADARRRRRRLQQRHEIRRRRRQARRTRRRLALLLLAVLMCGLFALIVLR